TAASLFAVVSAGLVAYLLARRLVGRLEQLGRAVEAVAAGDMGARVQVTGSDEVGQLAGRVNVMASDLQRTLRELRAERDRVAGLLDDRRQVVAGVSHELRTPVATIRGYLEAALRPNGVATTPGGGGQVATAARSELETMERELGRLERLIDELFTLS